MKWIRLQRKNIDQPDQGQYKGRMYHKNKFNGQGVKMKRRIHLISKDFVSDFLNFMFNITMRANYDPNDRIAYSFHEV